MAVTYTETGYYSSLTGQTYPDAQTAHSAESYANGDVTGGGTGYNPTTQTIPGTPSAGTGNPAGTYPTPDAGSQQAAAQQAAANDQTARWDSSTGSWTYVPMSPQEAAAARLQRAEAANQPGGATSSPTDPNASASDIVARTRQQLGLDPAQTTAQRLASAGASPDQATPTSTFTRGTAGTAPARGTPATPNGNGGYGFQASVTGNPSQPPVAAPTVDTSASDKSVAGVNNTINQLLQLANTSPETSAAQAQLLKSDQLAKLRAIDELRNNQDAALGAARSARNPADVALLERQGVGTSAYLGTKAQNQDVLRQAELEGNQAILRANEDTADKNARAAMLAKAGDLGLNVAALQVDVSKADLTSANNYINDQFQQLGIDKQVGAQEMGQVLQFSQAMSAIKYDYDKMSDADQQHTLDLMMTQYGIDANTQVAMKQIAANHKGTLEKVFDGLLGLAGAAAPVVATAVGGPVAGAAVGAGMQAADASGGAGGYQGGR